MITLYGGIYRGGDVENYVHDYVQLDNFLNRIMDKLLKSFASQVLFAKL